MQFHLAVIAAISITAGTPGALGAAQSVNGHPVPTADNFAAWRDHIKPSASELQWESIPWRDSFSEGILEADRQGKPLLLWAMNGHPLGCT